jgi:hypothetical protein
MSTERLYPLLKHAQLQLTELIGPALAPYGIDGRELAVLNAIADKASLSQQEVARGLGIDRTTMVAMVDALERKGLVRRNPHPADRRKNTVELTAAGRDDPPGAAGQPGVERRFLAPLRAEADASGSGGPQHARSVGDRRGDRPGTDRHGSVVVIERGRRPLSWSRRRGRGGGLGFSPWTPARRTGAPGGRPGSRCPNRGRLGPRRVRSP